MDKLNKELKARLSCTELELARMQLEVDSFDVTKKKMKEEINNLKAINERNEIKIKELTYTVNNLNKQLADIGKTSEKTNKDQQKTLESLKSSLSQVESLVSYRSTTCKKHLTKMTRTINTFSQNFNDTTPQIKTLIKKFTKDLTASIEEIGKIVSSGTKNDDFEEDLKESLREKDNTIEEYRKTLETMREKMLLMREKVREAEVSQSKKGNADSEKRIKFLLQEKEDLKKQVQDLEESLREQSAFVTSLKEAMNTVQEDNNSDIDDEIALVDQEILELQQSLERALTN
ncbi:hypothetical protein SteCoe_9635 [Stentor coeruleus]|uniref:Uncharacterized protein n=1 Tax=Stentor coeruleus TaxID=5963 RepID=A0A1R2CHJ0_9CILI|nr:hypothetical protein SteCoe_9635 [Stentor coeruleus]